MFGVLHCKVVLIKHYLIRKPFRLQGTFPEKLSHCYSVIFLVDKNYSSCIIRANRDLYTVDVCHDCYNLIHILFNLIFKEITCQSYSLH
jgi:hypothetical protein